MNLSEQKAFSSWVIQGSKRSFIAWAYLHLKWWLQILKSKNSAGINPMSFFKFKEETEDGSEYKFSGDEDDRLR